MPSGLAAGGQHMRLLRVQSRDPAADRFALRDRVVRHSGVGTGLVENALGQRVRDGVVPSRFGDGGGDRGVGSCRRVQSLPAAGLRPTGNSVVRQHHSAPQNAPAARRSAAKALRRRVSGAAGEQFVGTAQRRHIASAHCSSPSFWRVGERPNAGEGARRDDTSVADVPHLRGGDSEQCRDDRLGQ